MPPHVGAIAASLAARAGYLGEEFPERLVRVDFPLAAPPPTVAFPRNVRLYLPREYLSAIVRHNPLHVAITSTAGEKGSLTPRKSSRWMSKSESSGAMAPRRSEAATHLAVVRTRPPHFLSRTPYISKRFLY
jgi:hypothetical protein